jgi:histidine triad (HIT) family protein
MTDNLFQKIIDCKIPADIVYEDDRCLAFRDIRRSAGACPHHPEEGDRDARRTHEADGELIGHLHVAAVKLAKQLGLSTVTGWCSTARAKADGATSAPALLGGRPMAWLPG